MPTAKKTAGETATQEAERPKLRKNAARIAQLYRMDGEIVAFVAPVPPYGKLSVGQLYGIAKREAREAAMRYREREGVEVCKYINTQRIDHIITIH